MGPNSPLRVNSGRFFERGLPGEEPPSWLTMKALYDSAMDLFVRQPWALLTEDELVLVETPRSTELCFCSVMGALGEVRSLYVYIGLEAFQTFEKLHDGETMTAGEFYAGLRGVSVEFVRPSELTRLDRAVLEACGYPFKRGMLAPIFRSSRPGYHPWYVTEGEARILDECQQAAAKMCELVKADPDERYWSKKGVYPLFAFKGDGGEDVRFRIRSQEVPRYSRPMPEPATLDQSRIQRICESQYPAGGVLEVDHFYGPGMIGKKNERKACFRMALAVEAKTGHAYPPEACLPEPPTGDVLARVVLNAIEDACAPGGSPREKRRVQSSSRSFGASPGLSCEDREVAARAGFRQGRAIENDGRPGSHSAMERLSALRPHFSYCQILSALQRGSGACPV